MTYDKAMEELESLVDGLEDPQKDFAVVQSDVKRAMELVKWCRKYIEGSRQEIDRLVDEKSDENIQER